jgi:hypothetical protein
MKSIAKFACAALVAMGLVVSTGNTARADDAGVPVLVETVDAGTAPVDAGVALADAGPGTASPAPSELPTFPPPSGDEMSTLRQAYYGVVHGDNKWRALAALLLVGMVYMTRRYGGSPIPVLNKPFLPPGLYAWFSTDRGGVALVFLMASMGALGHALAADVVITFVAVENAFMVGVSAAGAYVMARRLAAPADKKEGSS